MNNLLIRNKFALRTSSFFVLLSIAFSLLPLSANAQTTEPPPSRQLVMKEKTTTSDLPRLALVIGNAKYTNMTPLRNSTADAVDMAAALRSLGFEVLEGEDQNKKQMVSLIREFGDKLSKKGGVGVFFYAGHGVQSNGKNYLIPADADIPNEDEIQYAAVDVGLLLAKMDTAKNDLNIIILDACRNNPLAKEWSQYRSTDADNGLAKINAPKGTILFYATEPGKAASDGAGRNGLFTEALLENIKKPLEFDALFKAVARSVGEKSKQLQRPYKEGNSVSDFYFAGETPANPVLPSPVVKTNEAEPEPEIKEKDAAAVEQETWNYVKNSRNAQGFRDFLETFPNGANAAKAKIRLEQIAWDSVKSSNDKALVQKYLNEFPNGASVPTARFRLKQLEAQGIAEPVKTEIAKTEPEITEPPKAEPAETEPEESQPVKKIVAPKASAVSRAAKTKAKPSAAGISKLAVRKNSLDMEFVYLPASNFMMGSSEANANESYALGRKDYKETEREWFDNEKPQHRVSFEEGFWIGKTEVTQAQWTAVMDENPSNHKDCDDCPVERVSWEDAKKFVEKLNAKNDGFEYRLPSEAEWEYAARGGKAGILAGKMDDMAWYHENSENKTHSVATLQPNAFGLFDMHGNVAEWCEDIYTENYAETPVDGTANASVGEPAVRVLRGGTYNDFPTYMRLPRRDKLRIKIRSIVNGLRVVAVEKQ